MGTTCRHAGPARDEKSGPGSELEPQSRFEFTTNVPLDSAPPHNTAPPNDHCRSLLASTTLIGLSQLLSLAIGLVRTKMLALLLGPAGVGLMGVYASIADLTRCLAELGVNSAGVRQIAAAAGSDDMQRVARTAWVLRRLALLLGLLGAAWLLVLARPLAQLTFGSAAHTGGVALLSLALLLRLVSDAQGALLQGLHRVDAIATTGVLGALLGAVASIACVAALGAQGAAPALVAMAAASLLTTWWTTQHVLTRVPTLSASQWRQESGALLHTGLAFMASSLLTLGAAYMVRVILVQQAGLSAAGLYQTAWSMGGLGVSFILQAMSTDFYPRLVAMAGPQAGCSSADVSNEMACNHLVNDTSQLTLLLAGPAVTATITFAPALVAGLYSAQFSQATDLLRWIGLGMTLRALSWPLGYLLIARGRQAYFIGADMAWTLSTVGLTWLGMRHFGLAGVGLAVACAYLSHVLLVSLLAWHTSGFIWSTTNRVTAGVYLASIAAVQAGFYIAEPVCATAIGSAVLLAMSTWGAWRLHRLAASPALPHALAHWLPGSGPTPAKKTTP
jgi:PST family polysaccharide transporter